MFTLTVNNAGLALSTVLKCVPINMAKELFEGNFFGTLRASPLRKLKNSHRLVAMK